MDAQFEFEVALSFAGEQRPYVESVAKALRDAGVRVFYDTYEQVNLWGKDLYEHLDYVYQRAAQYCVVFASAEYAEKMWTTHERRSAQARAIDEKGEYILPARFDATEIPGIRKTIGYIDLQAVTPEVLAQLILEKLGPRRPTRFFPPEPVRVYEMLDVEGTVAEEWARHTAAAFFQAALRMTVQERLLLFEVFAEGCNSKLPENVHVSLDLLRRTSGIPPTEIVQILSGMSSLGVEAKPYASEDHDDPDMIEVRWENRWSYPDTDQDDFNFERSTEVARAMMLGASADQCAECAREALEVLDFSALSLSMAFDDDEDEEGEDADDPGTVDAS
ncbi:toll/interleukin-1 receptor domain-containing protein [Nocardioides sp. L-11A]|uniref:toll/interleukin-1 receptor domain-containing protein n=1 Tax=Nocardioides sp. L-11A TaxID=3043848 RepID=UPI002499FAE1|nr:TIR domain-containing protein [Nocardioides sp. L-11A]